MTPDPPPMNSVSTSLGAALALRLDVALSPAYPVHIGADLLAGLGEYVRENRVALISDAQVAPLYAQRVADGLQAGGNEVTLYTVPGGEASKSIAIFGELLRGMIRDRFDRGSAVVALGGGVVGDLAGFVAASFMRGVAFYQCPTSLLAMVDASVGGKTGVNLPEGKNLAGAFWQPRAVVIDIETLRSLPGKEFRQGAVELFKHGLLADTSILEDVARPEFRPDGPGDFLASLIGRSVAVKARIVATDPQEAGERAFLNLGHTLAHALEAASDHAMPHGDAVAYGLLFMAALSRGRGFADETERVRSFLRWVRPVPLKGLSIDDLLPYLARDKKHLGGRQRWVLLEEVGKPLLVDDLRDEELREAWRYVNDAAAEAAKESTSS